MEACINMGMDAFIKMVKDKWTNFWNMPDNLNTLETEHKRLSDRAFDLKQQVTEAERTGKKKRKREVGSWFEEVKKTEDEFNALKSLIQDGGRLRNICNICSGDSVVKLLAKVKKQLLEQSQTQHFEDLLADDHDYRGDPLGTTELFGDKFKEGLTTICNWLVTDNLFNIGIYGQGGVGKTTLAKHIHNHLLETTDFKVYWVTVSQESSIKKLQEDIAKLVKLDLSGEDNEVLRAARLSRSLAHQQSVLILDDVWEKICLENIGIAHDASKLPNNPPSSKCRLILTTRSLQLCNEMLCQKKFDVKTLNTNDAWNLFKFTLGLKTELTPEVETVLRPDVEETAKEVAGRCAGLPLGIITVAGSMRGVVDISEWRNALRQLNSCSVGFKEMEDNVFPILEWSFNRLNGCERPCFLYCCLYPEDWKIEREELIDLFVLAELIPRSNNRESEHDHGHTILNKLVRACLLEEIQNWEGRECIKMHDLIRDMALRITGRKSRREKKGDVPRIESNVVIVEESEWTEDLNAVSFARYRSLEIPLEMSPNCQNLSTLLFEGAKIEKIPDSFFRRMDGLKVLDLRRCFHLKELPNYVSNLVNLTALLLRCCSEIKSVPPLGKLKQLRELDLSHTRIDDIPQGLELLSKLERLDMDMLILKKKIIPKGTFSKLNRLQHLVLRTSVQVCDPQVLKQLQVFSGRLSWMDVYNEFMKSGCWPKHYAISVVEEEETPSTSFYYFGDTYYNNRKALDFGECHWQKGLGVDLIPEDIKELILSKCFRLSDGNLHNLIRRSKDLVDLQIIDSEEVEFLFNFSSPSPSHDDDDEHQLVVLPNLRELNLNNLPNLVGLINWGRQQQQQLIPPPPGTLGTFSSLTHLDISKCHRLKKLFTVQLLSQHHTLQNLEYLDVSHCEQLEEMIAANDNDEGMGEEIVIHPSASSTVRLPKLQRLNLINLPQLENKNCKAISIISDSIEDISVYVCPKLKMLPLYIPINNINTNNVGNGQTSSSTAPPKTLRVISGSKEWWESLEWDHYPPNSKDALLQFFKPTNSNDDSNDDSDSHY